MKNTVTGECKTLHNEELYDLHFLPNIIWMIKSRMGWAARVACMGKNRGAYRVLVVNWRERGHLEHLSID